MTNILDQFQKNSSAFRPVTPKQYAALQLARKLDKLDQVRVYAALFERYTLDVLLPAVRRMLRRPSVFALEHLESEIEARLGEEGGWQN